MNLLKQQLRASPIHARVVPYVVIVALTVFQDSFQGSLRFWMYALKMLVGAYCIWQVRDIATEVRWSFSWEAVVVGVFICFIWVAMDPYYPKNEIVMKKGTPWNPFTEFGAHSLQAWFFVAVRTFGSAIIVPPIEEAFFRSFVYRWGVRMDFTEMSMRQFHLLSLAVTSALFGLIHYQWIPGILCGLAFQGLVLRKGRLGDAMLAHGITNFLLGIWIVYKGDWQFW
jgi:CAAX prenyl protease-like protein